MGGDGEERVLQLEAELVQVRAQHQADVARRDAVLMKCKDAILSLEAQLVGEFRAAGGRV